MVCPSCVSSTVDCALSSILAPLSADHLFYEAGRGPAHGCRPWLLLPHFLFHERLFTFSTSLPPVWGCLLCCRLLLPLGSHSLLLGSCLFCLSVRQALLHCGPRVLSHLHIREGLGISNNLFPFVHWPMAPMVCGGLLFKM